ncbi:hypothetical protein VTH82DRAFT_8321 [Thermothelomyces myriococcoides]
MASTPSSRIKFTPSNSPFLSRPSRSQTRPRGPDDPCLSLQRVVGTTCTSPTGFDAVHSSFAYIAGGAVVVVDLSGEHYAQRFFRARPSAVPLLSVSPATNSSSTPNATPKANDGRNRSTASPRDSLYAPTPDWPPDPPTPKTWTSRERIKTATCLALSRDGRYLAVGETGYAPRVLIFNLQDASSDVPLVSISEHTFGVKAVAWSPDTKYLATLGAANDGFLYLWKVDSRTGAVKLFQQNRCTSFIKGMVWMGNSNLITLGVRHVKVWRVEDGSEVTPANKPKLPAEAPAASAPQAQKTLPGRNILLGSMLDAAFSCAIAVSDDRAIICSETGCVCLIDDTNKQMKLTKMLEVGFVITCISRLGEDVYIGGKEGQFAVVSLDDILSGSPEPTIRRSEMAAGFSAMGFLAENLVTISNRRSIDIWSAGHIPSNSEDGRASIPIPGVGGPIAGIQQLPAPNATGAAFFTWSRPGRVAMWNLDGVITSSFELPVDQTGTASDPDQANQVVVAKATNDGSLFFAGDKLGVLRVFEAPTGTCLLETKAHSSDCQDITVYEGASRFLVASCGRDRTVQLFHRSSADVFEHFQTLEFSAKVVQVLIPTEDKILTCSLDRTLQIHDIVSKEGEPDVMAAIPSRVISLKASPSSMTVTADEKTIFVSLLDRSVCQYEFSTGRQLGSFKCNDEAGLDSVVLESLTHGHVDQDLPVLLGVSNTDKSVRVYDAREGCFIDREWGHTESINGVILIDNEEYGRKVVSVGEDGTIMIWGLEFQDQQQQQQQQQANGSSRSREPSPEKTVQPTSAQPPLRRVLSKAELAEFQRPSSAPGGTPNSAPGRRSPPRPSNRRTSKFPLPVSSLRTPSHNSHAEKLAASPPVATNTDEPRPARTPSRRPSSGAASRCSDDSPPPESPKGRPSKTTSLPVLGTTPSSSVKSRKASNSNLRSSGGTNGNGFGTFSMATEQTCRQLKAFRKKLASADVANHTEVLIQLDAELRLTAAALREKTSRCRASGGAGAANHRGQRDKKGDKKADDGGSGGDDVSGTGYDGSLGLGFGVCAFAGNEVSEVVLSGLLDQYSERLVSMLDEKLRLRLNEEERDPLARERPPTAGEDAALSSSSSSSTCSASRSSSGGGATCEESETT